MSGKGEVHHTLNLHSCVSGEMVGLLIGMEPEVGRTIRGRNTEAGFTRVEFELLAVFTERDANRQFKTKLKLRPRNEELGWSWRGS